VAGVAQHPAGLQQVPGMDMLEFAHFSRSAASPAGCRTHIIRMQLLMSKFCNNGVTGIMLFGLLLPFSMSVAVAGSKPMAEPLFTRYARIYQAPTLDFRSEFFRDKPMEEMTDFDGYTLSLDFTYPFNERSQLQVSLPFYTNGDGDYDKPGNPDDGLSLDVKGNNGVRDFFSLIYERRFSWLEAKTGGNVAWLAGIGRSMDPLDATRHGDLVDRFNHRGNNAQIGLKFDDDIRDGDMTLLGNLRLIMYWDTDDINLTGDSTSFQVLSATAAVMFNPYRRFTPVLEAILEADFDAYTAFSLAPELMYTLTDHFDIKLGVPFRLTRDGQKVAADLELTYRF
jgi:hypothetical protein